LGLAIEALGRTDLGPNSANLVARARAVSFLPPLFWTGTVITLLPRRHVVFRLVSGWWPTLYVVAFLAAAVVVPPHILWTEGARLNTLSSLFVGLAIAPLFASLVVLALSIRVHKPSRFLPTLLVVSLLLELSFGLFLVPGLPFPRSSLVFFTGIDLILLGFGIAALVAFELGETLVPHLLRSLLGAALTVAFFGGQAYLIASFGTPAPDSTTLFSVLMLTGSSLVLYQLAPYLQRLLDRIVFSHKTELQKERALLIETYAATPRIDPSLKVEALDSTEFAKLTRRALSHLGDMGKLASSQLTNLTIITDRLSARGSEHNTLAKTHELKRLLMESIAKLKPSDGAVFGSTDAWRYYNVLYFPYVVGIRPYSQRANHVGLDPASEQALEWFRTFVPDSTYYNWQRAAAELVARDLLERCRGGV
jgi:hypothetical protein